MAAKRIAIGIPNFRRGIRLIIMMKRAIAYVLILILAVGMLAGCGSGNAKFSVEPFAMDWGLTQSEVQNLLKCVYLTNAKNENTIYVMGADNPAMQAFGTTPKMMIYTFNLLKDGSDEPRLGKITISFPSEDYGNVLAYLEGKLGKSAFSNPRWGAENTDIYLFDTGAICIEYSSNPIQDPDQVDKESRDRYILFSDMAFSSMQDIVELEIERFSLLWRYSTAETDFVKVDNTK
jgi:hypothetical protein